MRTAIAAALSFAASSALGAELDARTEQMIERALQQVQEFRDRAPALQYDAKVHVTEWNGKGEVRGTADARMTVRPGDAHQITYLSREVHGRVKLPEANNDSKQDESDKTTIEDFARQHRINERFDFNVAPEPEEIAAGAARKIDFTPRARQPEKAQRIVFSIPSRAARGSPSRRTASVNSRCGCGGRSKSSGSSPC